MAILTWKQWIQIKQWSWSPEQTQSLDCCCHIRMFPGWVGRKSEEPWILILQLATIVSSIVVRPCFINPVTALTPWGCVCFHYKGDWAEWWSGSQPADKTKPFTKNILQQPADSFVFGYLTPDLDDKRHVSFAGQIMNPCLLTTTVWCSQRCVQSQKDDMLHGMESLMSCFWNVSGGSFDEEELLWTSVLSGELNLSGYFRTKTKKARLVQPWKKHRGMATIVRDILRDLVMMQHWG